MEPELILPAAVDVGFHLHCLLPACIEDNLVWEKALGYVLWKARGNGAGQGLHEASQQGL